MVYLENDRFRAAIDEKGAELSSLIGKSDGTEYVWQGDPNIWARHAPLLFPVIGRLKGKQYTLNGQAYSITQHGFGRDLEFSISKQCSPSCVELTLVQNDITKRMYPYDFSLTIRYTLDGNQLKKEHIMQNPNDIPLYYEVGGHDGYNICLSEGETIQDSYVQFEGTNEMHPLRLDENILLTGESDTVLLDDGRLWIDRETFRTDAIMMESPKIRRLTICSQKHSKKITVAFDDFDYVGIWSAYKPFDVPYVCIEPWSTLPDCSFLGQELEKKVGVRCVAPRQSETLTFTTIVSE
ncbi:aldose 1-epimerase family protein [Clostridiaceae bacterium]|nr:aldose 1-epimerase family protein [Clostridiaceae bacterium]